MESPTTIVPGSGEWGCGGCIWAEGMFAGSVWRQDSGLRLFTQLYAALGRLDGTDGSVGVEVEAVYAHFAVNAGILVAFNVVLVDAVVYDVPLVGFGNLEDGIVGGAVNLSLVVLPQDDGVCGHLDGSQR